MATPMMSRVSEQVLSVIRGEYSEMPAMRLTRAQFRRLWQLDDTACDGAISSLMGDGFLNQDRNGRLHRTVDA